MSMCLPVDKFKWLDHEKFGLAKFDERLCFRSWSWILKNSLRGCVLEINLEYLKKLHELHNDYPLSPHKFQIKKEMFSDYQLKIDD